MDTVQKSWTDDLPICNFTGVGDSVNQQYLPDGRLKEVNKVFDRKSYCAVDENTYLYSIFAGEKGSTTSEFALDRMSADILLGRILTEKSDEEIRELLKQTFISAEKGYHQSIDNLIATKQQLQFQILDLSQFEISQKYEDVLNRLNTINKELNVGTGVLIALIVNKKMYIANLGICRALLCKTDVKNDVLRVIQVTVSHNLYNEEEVLRLCELGLDISSLQNALPSTRCIGNYLGKNGYKDCDLLSASSAEPISSEPEIIGPIAIDSSCRFMLLLSGGLCKALHQLFSQDLNIVNKELVQICVQEFHSQSTLHGVAQSVIHKITQLHHDLYMKNKGSNHFNSRDDMTLLIRNFNYPMPNSNTTESSIERQSTISSSTTGSQIYTNASNVSYSSTSTSGGRVNYEGVFTERKVKPYVDFTDYFENVDKARKSNTLQSSIEFD